MIANIRSPLIRRPLVVLAWLVVVSLAIMCAIGCAVTLLLFFAVLFVMERTGDNAWRGPLKRSNMIACTCTPGFSCYGRCRDAEVAKTVQVVWH